MQECTHRSAELKLPKAISSYFIKNGASLQMWNIKPSKAVTVFENVLKKKHENHVYQLFLTPLTQKKQQ